MNFRAHFHRLISSRNSANYAKWHILVGATLLSIGLANAADVVWIGGSGNWDAAANWSPAQVPTSADNAFITNNGTYTVTAPNAVDPTIASLVLGGDTGVQTLSLGRSIVTLNGASVVNANGLLVLTVGNSTVTGAGNLTVKGTLNWAGGTISGSGVTSIGTSGVVSINGGVTLTGRTLNNAGHVSWDSGNLTAGSGAVINNLVGGTFEVTFDSRLSVGTAPATLNNFGLFRKTAGVGIANLILPFNNNGTVQAQSGTLSLDAGGTHSGSFSSTLGATLNFGGGSHVLSVGSVVSGAGTLGMSGNGTTLDASGNFDSGSLLNVMAGVTTLASDCNVTEATITVSGGILNFNSAGSVGVMNMTSGTLGGTSPVTITGPLTLSGGSITNALVTASGGLGLSGGFTLNGGKLINPATAIWSAGNFTGANGAVFSNLLGATFINTFDGNAPSGAGAAPTFVNDGVFQKTNGTAALGTTSIDFRFLNSGTVEVRTNTLRYNFNQQTAGLTLLNGGGLTAQAQPLEFLGGSLVGTGLVTVANVQNVLNASAMSPGLPIGRLDIAGNYQQTAAGTLNVELAGYTAGTTYDLVTVTAGGAGGVATLGGTLNVSFANNFAPTNGATFTFLTANSRVGAFSSFSYPSNEIGLQVSYDATSAKVTVSNLKPVVANPIPEPVAIVYGDAFNFQFPANTFADPDLNPLTYTATGLPLGITFTSATRTFAGTAAQAGVFPVSVVANDGGSPSLSMTNTFTITVNPASLTITADPQAKLYGATEPALTFSVGGLQLSDTASAVLTGGLTRATGETVASGPYAITQGTLAANSNYSINFAGNALTIIPAALAITADDKTKVYGASDPAFTASYSGFVNNENPAALGGTLGFTRAPGSDVGGYLITPNGLTSGNYDITFHGGTLTITTAPLTITAKAKDKTYGTALTLNGATDFTSSGLLNAETIGSVSLTANGSPAGTATNAVVGAYTITPSAAAGGTFTAANYSITYASGPLTVNQADLAVTAEAKTKIYGAADPTFTVTYSGFVNGETATVLSGTLTIGREPGENVGEYLITPSGLDSGNYKLIFNTGTLTVTRAPLTITAVAKTKLYGASDPPLTFTTSGLQFGDTPETVLAGALTRAAGEGVAGSPYAITQGTLTPNGNYTINFIDSTLTISKVPLSVVADAKTKVYGAADPTFTVTYGGFVNGETSVVMGGTLILERAPGESAGTYLITPSGATSGNYAINFTSNTLTITPRDLIVAASSKTKTYGAALTLNGAADFTTAGLQNGETIGSVTLTASGSPPGTAATAAAGSYTISPSEATGGTINPANYSITYATSALTVNPAPISVTADAKTKTFGTVDPAFTVTYSGFVNGETSAVLGGSLQFTRASGEGVGSYLITPSGLTSGNYLITYNSGTLTITAPAPQMLPVAFTGSNVIISWNAVSNSTYRVQYKTNLLATSWNDLSPDVIANAATASKTDILTTTRFYRVQVLPLNRTMKELAFLAMNGMVANTYGQIQRSILRL